MSAGPAAGVRQFRRRIVAIAEARGVRGALEDDFHHFEAELDHDGERVTAIRSASPRVPRTTCAEAQRPLQGFIGLRLDAGQVPLDPRLQCTHLFDLTRFMMAQALRGQRSNALHATREYAIAVPYPEAGRMHAEIRRDGELVLAWDLVNGCVVSPGPFLGTDFSGKASYPKELDADALEAAKLLRRGVWLGRDRAAIAVVISSGKFEARVEQRANTALRGACYAHQPGTQERGTSNFSGNIRDFSDEPEAMLTALKQVL